MSKHGIPISSQLFGDVNVKPKVVRSPADVSDESFDYIVICSKVTIGRTPTTAEIIKPAIGPSTVIVLAQNGIGIEEEYAAAFPRNILLSGSVYLPTTQDPPGRISMGNLELLEIGPHPLPASATGMAAAHDFAGIFSKAGATCKVFEDVQSRRWRKLMVGLLSSSLRKWKVW